MTVSATRRAAQLRAADVWSAPVVSIAPDASIWSAWSLMTATGLRHLAVVAGERCVGVVDDRAVFAQWPMGPLAMRRRCVADIMRSPATCVLPEVPLRIVATVMLRDGVDVVPVVDATGVVVGIVTGSDVVAAVAESEPLAADAVVDLT